MLQRISFDVICAGEAEWRLASAPRADGIRFEPGGGAINAALTLARHELRVGLATVLTDDTLGRALSAKVASAGIDVGGVLLSQPTTRLFFVRGGARQVASYREEEQAIEIPEGWSAQVLLLSGMSPIVAHGAALCRAARAARRVGSVVVVDLHARWDLWKGRDPRAIQMLLKEADAVWCSAEDLLGLNMDIGQVRSALRKNAVLAARDGTGRVYALGPFGEIAARRGDVASPAIGESDAFVAAICAEVARAGGKTMAGELWLRALERGAKTADARASRRARAI